MDILVFKILTDVCFYMAMFMPLFLSGPLWVRVLLFLALASWCVWLLVCWKKRNMEERAHDSLMTEARLLLAAGCIQWLSLGTEVWGRRCVPFFTAFLVLGIFLLRALRLARTGQGRGGFWGRTAGELLAVLAAAVTLLFYFILAYFNTANLLPSTVSVTTSFGAAYLTFRRNPWYAAWYAANDLVLVVLWVLASTVNIMYISVTVCFAAFFANDLYGFINWRRIEARQVEKP